MQRCAAAAAAVTGGGGRKGGKAVNKKTAFLRRQGAGDGGDSLDVTADNWIMMRGRLGVGESVCLLSGSSFSPSSSVGEEGGTGRADKVPGDSAAGEGRGGAGGGVRIPVPPQLNKIAVKKMKSGELKKELKSRGISTQGQRSVLIDRLTQALADCSLSEALGEASEPPEEAKKGENGSGSAAAVGGGEVT